jgi:nucleotidyltransferase/DNA polymerase involved in DNA repair
MYVCMYLHTYIHTDIHILNRLFLFSLARIATSRAKPDGYYHISSSDALAFLSPLEVKALPGVGYNTVEKLGKSGRGRERERARAREREQREIGRGREGWKDGRTEGGSERVCV